ncbi:hypothetical protein Q2411_08670 [Escherichia coli]|nr:hypothetical protein [Escherichia coli]
MMNKFSYVNRMLRQVFVFSFITTPSIALFVVFMFFSFNNSIAGSFLKEVRGLITDTPSDKVNVCLFEKGVPQDMELTNSTTEHVLKNKCITTLVDAADWQESVDGSIRYFYWSSVVVGFVVWFTFNFSALEELFYRRNRKGDVE